MENSGLQDGVGAASPFFDLRRRREDGGGSSSGSVGSSGEAELSTPLGLSAPCGGRYDATAAGASSGQALRSQVSKVDSNSMEVEWIVMRAMKR